MLRREGRPTVNSTKRLSARSAAPLWGGLLSAPVVAWALYDFANTVFSMNIVSLYLPLWVVADMGGRDSDYALANSLSMALMFVSAPFIGALSDQAPRRMPFLVVTTIICVAFTAL